MPDLLPRPTSERNLSENAVPVKRWRSFRLAASWALMGVVLAFAAAEGALSGVELERINVSALIVHGSEDGVVPADLLGDFLDAQSSFSPPTEAIREL